MTNTMHRIRETYVPVSNGELYCREIGDGAPIVVIHGGPDFDHTCLLPDMDRLADGYHLVYYDQHLRGRSRGTLRLDDIAIERYVDDLDRVRRHVGAETIALLGHSWGGFVAMHYALAHPANVSRMILLNTASASNADLEAMKVVRARKQAPHRLRLDQIASSVDFEQGDPLLVAEYYRIDFGTTFKRAADARRLNLSWTREDILRGRAIEDRLAQGLFWQKGYTILPALAALRVPTLVIHGEADFFPLASSAHIAEAIPGARLVTIPDSGHFSYIDAPADVRQAIDAFMR